MNSLESLAARAQQGDRQCMEELSKEVREPLRAFLAHRLPSEVDADDLTQETLLRAFEKINSYDPNRPFKTWLFTIGKRLAINYVVADKARESRQLKAQHDSIAVVPDVPTMAQEVGVWEKAKSLLSDEAYYALWMRYAKDESVKEVAKKLGRTVVSTKVLLYRSRKRLLLELEL